MLSTCFVRSQLILANNKNQAHIKQPTLVVPILDFYVFQADNIQAARPKQHAVIQSLDFLLFIVLV